MTYIFPHVTNMDPADAPIRARSVKSVAGAWDLPERQVYTLIREGRLEAFMVGKHYRVTDDAMRRFEEAHRVQPTGVAA